MNLLKTNNTLHFSGTRPAVAALLFALALGVSTLASAAPKRGPNAKNQPVQAQPDVCTIQVDLADVVDTNAPDGEAPLSLIVSTQTQLWTEGSSQFQTTSTALEADSVGLVSPDLVDTAVAGYILEEGTAEVVQICSAIRADNDSPHASEIHCQELVVSCDMAGEAVASDVALCLDAGSVSEDLCPSEHTAVVRFTYTFTNPDLTVNTDLSAGAHIEDSDWGVQEANTGSVDHKTANNVGACWPPMVPHDPDGDGSYGTVEDGGTQPCSVDPDGAGPEPGVPGTEQVFLYRIDCVDPATGRTTTQRKRDVGTCIPNGASDEEIIDETDGSGGTGDSGDGPLLD